MFRRLAALLVVALCGVPWMATPAEAHALLASSEPGAGVSLEVPPRSILLVFTEEPDPALSEVTVLDASGRTFPASAPEAESGERLRVQVEGLSEGVFTVSWRVVSRVDGHLTGGAFAFGVGVDPVEIVAADVAEPVAASTAPVETAGRFLLYVGLALVAGVAWMATFGFARPPPRSTELMVVGWVAGLVGLATLGAAQQQAAGVPFDVLVTSSLGLALLGRAVMLGGILAAVGLRRLRPRAGSVAVLVFVGGAVAVHVASGHAATGDLQAVKVAVQGLHFVAAAVWIGGLAVLVAGLRSSPEEERGPAMRRFSTVAGLTLAVVAGTGIARAIHEVGSWSGLVTTGYGRVVVAKVVGLGVLASLGARNRYRHVPRGEWGGLRRVARLEIGVAAAVFLLAGMLASAVPPGSYARAQPADRIVLEEEDFARTVRVRLVVEPGHAGVNSFAVELTELRDAPETEGVELRLSGPRVQPSTLSLERMGDRWEATSGSVGVPGSWRVVVFLDRGARSVEVPFAFHTRCRSTPLAAPDQPRLHELSLGDQRSAQGYVDPGEPGANELHFTFFDAEGGELALADDPDIFGYHGGERVALEVRRFSPGHFIAGGDLEDGDWVFAIEAATTEGERVSTCFEEVL